MAGRSICYLIQPRVANLAKSASFVGNTFAGFLFSEVAESIQIELCSSTPRESKVAVWLVTTSLQPGKSFRLYMVLNDLTEADGSSVMDARKELKLPDVSPSLRGWGTEKSSDATVSERSTLEKSLGMVEVLCPNGVSDAFVLGTIELSDTVGQVSKISLSRSSAEDESVLSCQV